MLSNELETELKNSTNGILKNKTTYRRDGKAEENLCVPLSLSREYIIGRRINMQIDGGMLEAEK